MNHIAIRQRIIESFQDHDADAVAADGAACPGIKGAAVTVGRIDAALLKHITGLLRQANGNPTCERHVAFAAGQALARKMYGHQRT